MKSLFGIVLMVGIVGFGWLLLPIPAHAEQTYRFAIIVGANDGGYPRIPLRFAQSDASEMVHLIQELSGFDASNIVFLQQPSAADIRNAFQTVEQKINQISHGTNRVEFLFYYSGHSDTQGLLLQSDVFPYDELKQIVKELSTEVDIVILDSCASGAFLQARGGTRVPAFMIDTSPELEGHVYIVSSAENEEAQESSQIRGAFFSHFLMSGMRGAADYSNDGIVTLTEAYKFAYEETLKRSSQTYLGSQHPGYEIHLLGKGELILTDLREASSLLVLDENLQGNLLILDEEGKYVAEFEHTQGSPGAIALQPGVYQVSIHKNNEILRGFFQLENNARTYLSEDRLRPIQPEQTTNRGEAGNTLSSQTPNTGNHLSTNPANPTNPANHDAIQETTGSIQDPDTWLDSQSYHAEYDPIRFQKRLGGFLVGSGLLFAGIGSISIIYGKSMNSTISALYNTYLTANYGETNATWSDYETLLEKQKRFLRGGVTLAAFGSLTAVGGLTWMLLNRYPFTTKKLAAGIGFGSIGLMASTIGVMYATFAASLDQTVENTRVYMERAFSSEQTAISNSYREAADAKRNRIILAGCFLGTGIVALGISAGLLSTGFKEERKNIVIAPSFVGTAGLGVTLGFRY